MFVRKGILVPVVSLCVYDGRVIGDLATLPPCTVVAAALAAAAAAKFEPKILRFDCCGRLQHGTVALQEGPASARHVHCVRVSR